MQSYTMIYILKKLGKGGIKFLMEKLPHTLI